MRSIGPNDKKISDLTSATLPLTDSDWVPIVQAGSTKKFVPTRRVPFEYLLFHGGVTGVYTLTPLTAGTVEPANAPMARVLADLSQASQVRLAIGQRIVGAGGTTCAARLQWSTSAQSTWNDVAATGGGSDVSLQGGTANVIRAGSWTNLAAGAQIDDCYLRLVIVTTGTVTTAPTLSWASAMFR